MHCGKMIDSWEPAVFIIWNREGSAEGDEEVGENGELGRNGVKEDRSSGQQS